MKILCRKILIFFLFFAQNIDCGYTLEPPRRGGSNEYPQSMYHIKVGYKGIFIHGHVFLILHSKSTHKIATTPQVCDKSIQNSYLPFTGLSRKRRNAVIRFTWKP